MAAFLRRLPRSQLGALPGKLLLPSPWAWGNQPRSRGLLGGTLLGGFPVAGGGRSVGGVPFSSWTGGGRTWGHQPYRRSEIAKLGDWACLGLAALAGGLFWTKTTSRENVPLMERLLEVVNLYAVLRISLRIKLLRLRLKQQRHNLVLLGLRVQESEQKKEAYLSEVNNALQSLEVAILYKMKNALEVYKVESILMKVLSQSGDPFLESAASLLQRIEVLKKILSRSPEESNGRFVLVDYVSMKRKSFEVQLARAEMTVKTLVEIHEMNKAQIIQIKELKAKVDDMLLDLEKEK